MIETSADPSIFFGYNTETTEFGFRRLRLDASGITEIQVDTSLIAGFSSDIRSDGNKVFTTTGVELDGAQMRRLGTFPASGPVCPDLAANRVYFLEANNSPWWQLSGFDKIGAYDATTFANLRKLTLPYAVNSPGSFIRWGTNGLAFHSDTNVLLISSRRLVASDPPANLAATVTALPNPATVSAPIVYTLSVSNQGPNLASNLTLVATFSDAQVIQGGIASNGTVVTSSNSVTLLVRDLASDAVATLTVTTVPQSAGSLTCAVSATSDAIDLDSSNNTATKVVSVGFKSLINIVNRLRLAANNLVYDPTRNLLWASIPDAGGAALGKSVVWIDPGSGLISDPIPINGNPVSQCMALSANGRYLNVGLSDTLEVRRIDLDSPGKTSVRVPLGTSQWGSATYAGDIEPLEGDGTSFLMTSSSDHAAAVFDGLARRSDRTGIYTVDRIERTPDPAVFVGYNNYTSGFELSRLSLTPAGVSISESVGNVVSGYYAEIRAAGNLLLSSTGLLVDSANLTLVASLGTNGSPCLDLPNQRAYLASGNSLRGFDTTTYLTTATFPLPSTLTGAWAKTCLRWGLDGFALLRNEGEVYILRWSATIPASTDANADRISDAWEAAYFDTLNVNPAADDDQDGLPNFQEYLFATSPLQASANPVQVSTAAVDGQLAIRLIFPRRAGLLPGLYDYVISSDLMHWTTAQNVSERVLSAQIVDGVQVETVEALTPATNPVVGFLRFRWNPR